jgi:hypothetical protein
MRFEKFKKINDRVQSRNAFVDEREFELTHDFKKIDPYEVCRAVKLKPN